MNITDEQLIMQTNLEVHVEQSYLQDPERYLEDPLPMVTISVKDAYDLKLLRMDVMLCVAWRFGDDSEESPPTRYVLEIRRHAVNGLYNVYLSKGCSAVVESNTPLSIVVNTPTEKILYAAWLRERTDAWKRFEKLSKCLSSLKSAAADVYEMEFEDDESKYVRHLRRVLKALGKTLFR